MEERRQARIGTVTGLALLAGCTAVAAVAGGAHTIFATVLLGLLTVGLGHSLVVEIGRQALRRSAGGWSRHDTINTVLLGVWSVTALVMAILGPRSVALRAVGLFLGLAYASSCVYFVAKRRRAIAALPPPPPSADIQPAPSVAAQSLASTAGEAEQR